MLFITKRRIEKIKNDEKLERIVLNRRISYKLRAAALDRIKDDTVLARIMTVFIRREEDLNWKHHDKFLNELTDCAYPRINSGEAVNILREPILKKYNVTWPESLAAFIRRTNDKPCMLRLYKDQAEDTVKYKLNTIYASRYADVLALTGEDIERLKQCGCSKLEIVKNTPVKLLKHFAQELINEEVIRFYADNEAWIDAMRRYIPEETVLSALEGSEHRLKALEAYHIPDGVVHLSKCDFGDHDFVLVSEERMSLPDDEMRSESWKHYCCSRCGKKRVEYNDGWDRIRWTDEN